MFTTAAHLFFFSTFLLKSIAIFFQIINLGTKIITVCQPIRKGIDVQRPLKLTFTDFLKKKSTTQDARPQDDQRKFIAINHLFFYFSYGVRVMAHRGCCCTQYLYLRMNVQNRKYMIDNITSFVSHKIRGFIGPIYP